MQKIKNEPKKYLPISIRQDVSLAAKDRQMRTSAEKYSGIYVMEKNRRDRRYTVRMTESEEVELISSMDSDGYRSIAKYIRYRIFSSNLRHKKTTHIATDMTKRFVSFISDMKRVGNNYNQTVRAVNAIAGVWSGSKPEAVQLLYRLRCMERYMAEMVRLMVKMEQDMSETAQLHPTDRDNENDNNITGTMQTIMLCGNLTSDAEVRHINENERITFNVAVNDRSGGRDTVTYYSCLMRRTAILEHLKKGRKVALTGDLKVNISERDGQTFVNLNVYVINIDLMSPSEHI